VSGNLSITEAQIFTAVSGVLATFGLQSGTSGQSVSIIRGQVNRVPQPAETDIVVLWPLMRDRIATNQDTPSDNQVIGSINSGTLTVTEVLAGAVPVPGALWGAGLVQTELTIQADVHGPASADNATRIQTLWRDQYGVGAFQATGFDLAPLYTSDPRQLPFDNGEQQVEERWSIDLCLQANPIVTTPMQFADALEVTIYPVDILQPAA
jgi:hypothetical protein